MHSKSNHGDSFFCCGFAFTTKLLVLTALARGRSGGLKRQSREEETLDIRVDGVQSQEVIELIREHLASMAPTAPPESRHALDLNGLRGPDITLWAMWDGAELAGIGALKRLSQTHAENKVHEDRKVLLASGCCVSPSFAYYA